MKQDESNNENKLQELRQLIDGIDQSLLELLSKRKNVIQEIAVLKKKSGMTVYQQDRHASVILAVCKYGESLGLSEQMVTNLWQILLNDSLIEQEKIILP